MNRDDWIKTYHNHAGSWPALVGVYVLLICGMLLSANAML